MRKKIALITPGFLPVPAVKGGGSEMLITKLINQNEMEKLFDIDLYTIDDKRINEKSYKLTNVVRIRTKFLNNFVAKIINKIANFLSLEIHVNPYGNVVSKLLKKTKYDYLLIENNMYIFKKINKTYPYECKKIFHLHNDVGGIDKPIKLCKYIGKNADLILTVSEYLKEHFLKYTSVKRIEVLYNCIDVNQFKFDLHIREKYRKKYNIDNAEFIFLYVGRISKEKGLLPLVMSFSEMAKTHKNVKLFVVGDIWFGKKKKSSYLTEINRAISEIKEQVFFVGSQPIDEVSNFMSMADCIVVPTICEEAFGLVATEAMATSRALIVTDSGGLPEVVDASCAKIISRKNLVENLKNVMEKLLDDNNMVKQMGRNGYERIMCKTEFQEQNYLKNFTIKLKGIDD